jgi:replication factor C subunit 1
MMGGVGHQIGFPSLLGKISTMNKKYRLLKELHTHVSPIVSANKLELRLYYLSLWRHLLTHALIAKQGEGVAETVAIMDQYDMTKEDWEGVLEITTLAGQPSLLDKITPSTKSAFTRRYTYY